MSINYFEFAANQARQANAAIQARLHDTCGVCCAKIPAGGDLLCPSCRAIETADYEQRLADPYRYERREPCANHIHGGCVGIATGPDVLCVSCREKKNALNHEAFQKAMGR